MRCLATILLTVSISATSNAEVIPLDKVPGAEIPLEHFGMDPNQWALISYKMLLSIQKDINAYDLCKETLSSVQGTYEESVDTSNQLRVEKYNAEKEAHELKKKLFEYENPPWWKSQLLWGSVGLSTGVIFGGYLFTR